MGRGETERRKGEEGAEERGEKGEMSDGVMGRGGGDEGLKEQRRNGPY